MDVVDRIEFLAGLFETSEEKGNQEIHRCYLVDPQNPFEKFLDCEFETRCGFSKIVEQRMFKIIRNDQELQCANNEVPGILQLLLFLRFYAMGYI